MKLIRKQGVIIGEVYQADDYNENFTWHIKFNRNAEHCAKDLNDVIEILECLNKDYEIHHINDLSSNSLWLDGEK